MDPFHRRSDDVASWRRFLRLVAAAPSAVGSCVVSAIEFSFGPVASASGAAVTMRPAHHLVTDGAR